MKFIPQPWQLFLLILASSVDREQQLRIEYLQSEVAVLKEHIGKKRILLTDEQRRRLAVKGKMIGRKALHEVGSLLTPDTILRWHRQLVNSSQGGGTTRIAKRRKRAGQGFAK